jgi:bifunctional non-homologous end joining protein LigD
MQPKAKQASGKNGTEAKARIKKQLDPTGPTVKTMPAKKKTQVRTLLKNSIKSKYPSRLSPMLATLVDQPFSEEGWLYEIKWDGYRALSFLQGKEVELKSRNNKSFNDKFYPVTSALAQWNIDAVIDGEVVVIGDQGISHFGNLQNWRSEADGELYYYVFDILWYDGYDLTQLPLTERREILKSMMPAQGIIRYSENFAESGIDFFEAARQLGLEGIIAKKADSLYTPGARSKEWLKIKANKRQEMVIGGFTINDGTNKTFSSLLVGVFKQGSLVYTGKIGTGFNEKTQKEMMALFKPLIIEKSPFTELPDINKPSRFRPDPPHASATFLKPQLVCEVSFAEMTADGVMRHPSFEGMRIDKKAIEVHQDIAEPAKKLLKKTKAIKPTDLLAPPEKHERKTLLNPTEETQVRTVKGHELKFTNLGKLYWPEDKVSKRDMLNYYYQVAHFILPYLRNRPQSLNRHPNGIHGKSFYQKDVTGKAPDWIDTFLYHSDADMRDKHFLVVQDEASLLYMASLGCIEMNPWSSTVEQPDQPDWCVIDLDPGKTTFNQVIQAANVTHAILEDMGVKSYCKTSGSSGLHIYIPLGGKYTYEQSKEFARIIATLVQRELPKFTSIQRAVKDRGGKMYIDFLQNRPQATIACPYSLRPKPGATVSMPLHWEEVKKGLRMSDFNLFNAIDRIRQEGDIFKPVLGKGINLAAVIRKFEKQ